MMKRSIIVMLLFTIVNQYGYSENDPFITDTLIIASPDTLTNSSSRKEKTSVFQRIYKYFQESNEIKQEKRFDFTIIGGPHFASDTKLGLGLVASGLYRIDPYDLSISPSNVSLYGDITTTGFYLLGVRGNTIFPKEKYRIDLNLYFFSFPSKYWGIGYANGSKEDNYTTYKRLEKQVRIDLLRRVTHKTYIGLTAIYRHVNGKDFKDKNFLSGASNNVSSLGGGLLISYDSRDFIPNPYSGIYTKLEQIFFPGFMGNKQAFRRTEFIFRYYNQLWKGATLASDLQGIFNYGKTPWSMVALLGSSYQMRGYYEGQYRANDLIQTQIEIRQKIYNRHGVALWGGAGNVFSDFHQFKWKETLPTFGLGYRWEFKNRVNVRLDYGIGRGQSAFYFNINEAF